MLGELPYMINDADNHFTEPEDCFIRYIDPKDTDLAIRPVVTPDGIRIKLYAGRPSRFLTSEGGQITVSVDVLAGMLGGEGTDPVTGFSSRTKEDDGPQLRQVPGAFLNRLNPLRGLSDEERKAFIQEFRSKVEAFGNRDLRLALMDEQGINKALMFPASAHDIEYEFADNVDALYANIRAFNRWMHEEVGYVADGRMILPPYIAFADPEMAVGPS